MLKLIDWFGSPVVKQALSVDADGHVFIIEQQWCDGEPQIIYLDFSELIAMAQAARDYVFLPSKGASIQNHEDRLDAQDRHDEATRR